MSAILTSCYLCSQRRALLRRCLGPCPGSFLLSLANRGHDRNARKRTPGRPQRFAAEQRPHFPVHCPLSLLYEMGEIFALPEDDAGLREPVVPLARCSGTPTLIARDRQRESRGAKGFA
jgi:hypothetical protein